MNLDDSTRYVWLSRDPLILWHTERNLHVLNAAMPADSVIRVIEFQWDVPLETAVGAWQVCQRRGDRCILVAHSEEQYREWNDRGMPTVYVHQNAWLEESRYVIGTEPPTHDAAHVARAEAWKRHDLAAQIEQLIVVAPRTQLTDKLLDPVRHALIVPPRIDQWFGPDEVVPYMQQARVGLTLSASEGGSMVTGEYQLCGLPVVATYNTTRGKLGWLDPTYSAIVPPDPAAVATAVTWFVKNPVSPQAVRQTAIARSLTHRRRFVSTLHGILDRMGRPVDVRMSGIYRRMFKTITDSWRPIDKLLQHLEADCA